jgi:hypothetical protein
MPHLISGVIFLLCYALLFKDPALAGLVGWLAMLARQTGHCFFEPNGYDELNEISNEHKEAIKVGHNQKRKIVLLVVWGLVPVALVLAPTLFGLFAPPTGRMDFIRHVGLLWLLVGIGGGGLFRMIQLFATQGVGIGLTWVYKVLTDPLHNIALYWRSPLALLRGEMIDPTIKGAHWAAVEEGADVDAEQAPHLT